MDSANQPLDLWTRTGIKWAPWWFLEHRYPLSSLSTFPLNVNHVPYGKITSSASRYLLATDSWTHLQYFLLAFPSGGQNYCTSYNFLNFSKVLYYHITLFFLHSTLKGQHTKQSVGAGFCSSMSHRISLHLKCDIFIFCFSIFCIFFST